MVVCPELWQYQDVYAHVCVCVWEGKNLPQVYIFA